MSIFNRKKPASIPYDRASEEPALRCSICTGERTAGFRNIRRGRFREYSLIRNDRELREFLTGCGVDDCPTVY